MANPPFDLDINDPTDSSLESDFPANERAFRDNLNSYINTEHDPNTGYHAFQEITLDQRNALVSPPAGMLIYNTDSSEAQINTGTSASPTWTPLGGNGGFFDTVAFPTGSSVSPAAADTKTLYFTGSCSGAGLTVNLPDTTTITAGWTISVMTTSGKRGTVTVNGGASEYMALSEFDLVTTFELAGFNFELITVTWAGVAGLYTVTNVTPNSAAIGNIDVNNDIWGTNGNGQLGIAVGAGLKLVYNTVGLASGATSSGTSVTVVDSSVFTVNHSVIDQDHPSAIIPGTFISSIPDGTHIVLNQAVGSTVHDADRLLMDPQSATLTLSPGSSPETTPVLAGTGFFSGSGAWTIPAGVYGAKFTLLGGGGGGGAGGGDDPGGGGGAGGLGIVWLSGLTPGNTIDYLVGAGGAASSAGGDTTISSGTQTISAATAGGGGAGGDDDALPGAGGTTSGGLSAGFTGNAGVLGFEFGLGGMAGNFGTYGNGGNGAAMSAGPGSAGVSGLILIEYIT